MTEVGGIRPKTVVERLKDVDGVEQALMRAERQALIEHARAGRKIPVWQVNRVVWETPEVPAER
ncbi:MAG: hypothetical protein NTY19_22555 [Planctomycetota bacterium]|nr:hypothetical protein [Planctomycetota bacterium]